MKDPRDPEKLGKTLASVKEAHPEKTICECADMLEDVYKIYAQALSNTNGK